MTAPGPSATLCSPDRLAAVRRTGLAEAPPEPELERLARLAAKLFRTPMAIVTLVDDRRQFFASAVGVPNPWARLRETPLSHSFCRHVVESGQPLLIEDARNDPRVAGNLAIPELGIAAYLGIPLRSADRHVLGSLAVMDDHPRRWRVDEVDTLRELAASVETALTLRVEARRAAAAADETSGVLERIPEAVFVLDASGSISYLNRRGATILGRATGLDAAQLVGRDPWELVPSLRHSPIGDACRRAAREARPVEIEYVSRASGRTYEMTLQPSGAGVSVYVRDVTAHRLLEQQLRQAQKMEAVGQLAGGIAHDFNNLLTVVRTSGELALGALAGEHPARGDVHAILAAADRAAELTRRLLAFGRRQLLSPRVVDPGAVLRGVETMIARLIGEHIRVESRIDDVGHVTVDPGQLEQVLVNLAVNARDAMPGGGTLRLETARRTLGEDEIFRYALESPVTPFSEHPGEYVVLRVRDDGTGMSTEVQRHLFEPFFTTKPPGEGTGLGLATVYGIVAQSGGHVRVHSAPGEGTTFEVWLPRLAADVPAAAAPASPDAARRGTETLLLVEDDGAVRLAVRRLLESLGYQVLEARHGAEGLAVWRAHRAEVALVVSDLMMPEMGGETLAAALRAEEPALPVLFMSGYADAYPATGDADGPEAPDGSPLLVKPFVTAELARRVREAIDARAAGRAGARATGA